MNELHSYSIKKFLKPLAGMMNADKLVPGAIVGIDSTHDGVKMTRAEITEVTDTHFSVNVPIEVKSVFEGSVSYGVYADGYYHVMSMTGNVSGDVLI